MVDKKRIGRIVGIIITILLIMALTHIGGILYAEGKYIELTPIIFLMMFLLLMSIFSFVKPKKTGEKIKAVPYHVGLSAPEISRIGEDENLHLLLSSKDCVFITALASEFKKEGISYTVLDQYAGRMMKFLPDMEMKVMVLGKDYERCLSIAEDMADDITNSD